MAEEQRCQDGHRLCANNCGFFGSPATLDLCSKCYRDHRHRLKEDHASAAKAAVGKSLHALSSVFVPEPEPPAAAAADARCTSSSSAASDDPRKEAMADQAPASAATNRCSACRKKVGLTGFKCRCGATCCGAHRYPEQHACDFDFKGAGREAIARANPVVKADKLHKI